MKPLTPAQQRVVDVMKTCVTLRNNKRWGWFEYVDRKGTPRANVVNALIRKGVVMLQSESPSCFYYTLSPEYK